MLAALVDGRALPAGQLAGISGRTAQAATIHLAKLVAGGLLVAEGPKQLRLSQAGATWFSDALGFDVTTLRPGANGLACRCLDWTERRYHLAGPLGNTMLRRWLETGWLVPKREGRALRLTRAGQDGFRAMLGIGDDLTCEAA